MPTPPHLERIFKMTQELKYPDERQEARFHQAPNPHCAIVPCYHPGATLGEFCPYHKAMYDVIEADFKKVFIRNMSEGR